MSSVTPTERSTLINAVQSPDSSIGWKKLFCHWISLVFVILDHFTVLSATFIIVPLYTNDETTTGYLLFTWGVLNIISGLFVGIISHKYGCIFTLILSIITRSVSYSIFFLFYDAHSMISWYSALAVLGIAQNLNIQGITMYSSHYIPNAKRGRFNTSIMAFRRLSFFIGSLLSGLLIYDFNIKFCTFIVGVISWFALFLVCSLMTPPNYHRDTVDDHGNDSFLSLKNSYRDLNICARCCHPKTWILDNDDLGRNHGEESNEEYTPYTLCHVFRRFYAEILKITIFTFGLTYARTVRRIIITFQAQSIGLNAQQIGMINAVSYIPDSLLFPLSGYVMDKWGRKYNAVISIGIFSASLVSVSYCQSMDILIANCLLWGIGDGMASGLTMTIGTDLSPIKYRNQFYSIYRMFENIAGIVAPLVVGYLSSAYSIRFASFVSAIFTVISLFYAMIMTEPKKVAEQYQMEMQNDGSNIKCV